MYEVKSCGVTICFERSLYEATNVFDSCNGPEVVMYKFNNAGQKYVVRSKENRIHLKSSKQLAPIAALAA